MKTKHLILVSDHPSPLTGPNKQLIAEDASAEWEDEKTIEAIANGWEEAGWTVETMTVTPGFLPAFANRIRESVLVHSLTEGWGSATREAWIPSLCEFAGIPWIGSSPFGLTLAMDKDAVAALCQQLALPVPKGFLIRSHTDYTSSVICFGNQWHFIKPNAEGSGMGIDGTSLRPPGQPLLSNRISELLQLYPDGLRAEAALTGREFTAALVGSPPEFLPIAEIEVVGGIYGLQHKLKDEMTEKVTFPTLNETTHKTIHTACLRLWERLQLKDFCRFDWKCDENGDPFLIDINPLAGLSPYYSVLPKMWEHTGRSFSELLATLAASAARKLTERSLVYGKLRNQEPLA